MTHGAVLPLVEELSPSPDAATVFRRLSGLPHCIFLDSARRDARLGRYSFVAADPFTWLSVPADGTDALTQLQQRMCAFAAARLPDLPPFQGGAAGMLSYDLGRSLEVLPRAACDEFQLPALAVGLYDVVLAFDHALDRAWIISQGWPEQEMSRREHRARQRLDWFLAVTQGRFRLPLAAKTGVQTIDAQRLAPQYPVARLPHVTSTFTAEGYQQAVRRVIEYIYAGDAFQVNLAQRLLSPHTESSASLYERLRLCNPAPFAGYFDLGEFQILSASPERFLQVVDREVETRPIKGTRRRTGEEAVDRSLESELLASEKDRAENVMIVDLLRNDLSRVCEADSVRVAQLCGIERYEYVVHLVSAVRGRLREGLGPLDLVRAAFPGGSITGAPKIRAMEIIAELEPTARGAYCGTLGYLGFDGSMDLNILIRTITAGRGWLQCCVGGGIVAQSDPAREYEETWEKAEGMLRAYP